MADGSFIANVNNLAKNIDLIVQSSEFYTQDILATLGNIADLDLVDVTRDLQKGTLFGNRKIDIDLSQNKVGMVGLSDFNDIMALWTDTVTTVYYNQAVATFVDGEVITIDFKNEDGQSEVVSTHGGIVDQLEDSVAFQAKIKNTSIQEEVGGKVGSIIRISDIVGVASNLEEIRLVVAIGAAVEASTMHYWAKTTSALQVVADKMGHVADLLGAIEEITVVSNNIAQVVTVEEAINEVIGVYAKLSDIAVVFADRLNIETVSSNIVNVNTLASDSEEINTLVTNLNSVLTVEDNILDVNTVATDIVNVNAVADDLTAIDTIVLNLNAVKTAATNINNINIVALDSAKINTIVSNITALQMVYSNMTAVSTVSANIASITNINTNMPNLLPITTYMNSLLLIAQDIAAVVRVGENVDVIAAMKDAAVLGGTTATDAAIAAVNAKEAALLGASQAAISESNAQDYATSAANSMVAADASKVSAANSASAADTSAQFSSDAADRAEVVVSSISSIALIPLWVSGSDYTYSTQVINPADAEIYLCINSVTGSTTEPHLDLVNFKRILGVTQTVDGGYASVTVVEQTFDGGTANG